MTKKRYYTDGQYVMQNGEVYVACAGEHSADVVATALNESLDKNEKLKEEVDYFERKKYEYHKKWNLALLDNINLRKEKEFLSEENEQLKQSEKDCQEWNHKLINENEQLKQSEKDCQEWNHKLINENEQLKKENEHIETCFKMADSTYHMLQKQYQNIEIALSKYRKENEKLKKDLKKTFVSFAKADGDYTTVNTEEFIKIVNENEQLKKEIDKLKHRHSLLHDECLEAECDRDSLKKDVISLEKENENLNNVLEDFMVMLNRLQADSNNEMLQSMAKDMLRMMGKDIIGDSE